MHALLMLIVLALLQVSTPTPAKASQPQKHRVTDAQQQTEDDQRGTEKLPLFVKTIPALKTKEEAAQESQDRANRTANDRELVNLTARYVVFTGLIMAIGVLQLVVFGYQSIQLTKTVKAAGEQSEAMERYIGQATRSADAMENIANVIESGNKAIIRAYLSVVIGGAVYQERNDGVKFEGKPTLVNTGSTPAKNVKIRIAAEIVPYAQAETFAYPLPQEIAKAPAVTAPHQNYILSAIVKGFVPDADVPDIKHGREGKGALTVWGTVTYDDIFGQSHTTKFAQWLF